MDKTNFVVKLADKNIEIQALFNTTQIFLMDYLSEDTADFSVKISPSDLIYERKKSENSNKYSDHYIETLAVYRKIADRIIDHNIMLFHGSCVAVDGVAYLFTAKSGTGKSTHTRLWCEYFQENAVMINDDKPLIHVGENDVIVYGTPWNGKHKLSSNIGAPLKGICILERDTSNHIKRVNPKEAYPILLQQIHRPADARRLKKTLEILDKLIERVHIYKLGCTISMEAMKIAYNAMKGK